MILGLCGLPLSNLNLSLIMRKTSDKSKLSDALQSIWPVLPKTIKVINNKESLTNCHSQEETKELR